MAKKNNSYPEEIDLTSFSWVTAGANAEVGKPGCGGCHPGGGGLEYDRDGFRYDVKLKENPQLSESLDGDYYQSKWDKTGVVEADCLICHLPGYFFKERIKSFNLLNFQWGVVAGSGVGIVDGAVKDGEVPSVTYNKRFFNDDGKIALKLEAVPNSKNCLYCHGPADMIKRGFSWNDYANHDIHNARNIKCTSCHPGNKEHQFAKGNENLSTVRDDLDNTIKTCEECHRSGYMGAKKPVHRNIRPNHLEKLACEVCHIPQLGRSSALGLDVSNGSVRLYPRNGAKKIGSNLLWYPEVNLGPNRKLYPVNNFQPNLFTNKAVSGIYVPLFGKEILQGYETVRSQLTLDSTAEPLVNTTHEIFLMLNALSRSLQGNPRFDSIHPCYHSKGTIFDLDSSGNLRTTVDNSWASQPNAFNISHNVAPTQMALGANGCDDCHASRAAIFSNSIGGGKGDEKEKFTYSSFIASESSAIYLDQLHKYNAAKKYLIPLLCAAVFTLILFRENRARALAVPSPQQRLPADMLPLVALFLLVRNASFLFLVFTGISFFFNNISVVDIFVASPEVAVILHWSGGVLFLGSILGCMVIRRRIFPNSKTDICQLGITGGKALIVIMALSGSVMIFREHVASQLVYVCSLIHTLAAFVLIAMYAGQIYYGISRRLYSHQ